MTYGIMENTNIHDIIYVMYALWQISLPRVYRGGITCNLKNMYKTCKGVL